MVYNLLWQGARVSLVALVQAMAVSYLDMCLWISCLLAFFALLSPLGRAFNSLSNRYRKPRHKLRAPFKPDVVGTSVVGHRLERVLSGGSRASPLKEVV